jgi:hypothetical protein
MKILRCPQPHFLLYFLAAQQGLNDHQIQNLQQPRPYRLRYYLMLGQWLIQKKILLLL